MVSHICPLNTGPIAAAIPVTAINMPFTLLKDLSPKAAIEIIGIATEPKANPRENRAISHMTGRVPGMSSPATTAPARKAPESAVPTMLPSLSYIQPSDIFPTAKEAILPDTTAEATDMG